MYTKKSKAITGVVIVLIVLVVVFFYVMLHTRDAAGANFSLGQYLNGLADAAMDKEALSATSTMVATTSSTAATSGSTTGSSRAIPVGKPFIRVLSPASGTHGLTVVIGGGNFDPAVNYITFGPSDGQHAINGLPDNVIAAVASLNSTTLTFNVPYYGPSELQCDSTGKNCVNVQPTILPAGSYAVTVKTNTGVSNTMYFTIVR